MSFDSEESGSHRGMQYPPYRLSKKQQKLYAATTEIRKLRRERRDFMIKLQGKEVFKKNGWL